MFLMWVYQPRFIKVGTVVKVFRIYAHKGICERLASTTKFCDYSRLKYVIWIITFRRLSAHWCLNPPVFWMLFISTLVSRYIILIHIWRYDNMFLIWKYQPRRLLCKRWDLSMPVNLHTTCTSNNLDSCNKCWLTINKIYLLFGYKIFCWLYQDK